MQHWFKYFFYASLIFLVVALYKADYLEIPVIHNYIYLGLSFLFLFTGFVLHAISWSKVVKQAKFPVTYKDGIASAGLSVFGKYIPGKIWVILGRSEYLAKTYQLSRKNISVLSLNAQFISLWSGLLFGVIGIIAINKLNVYGISALSLFILLSVIIYTPFFHDRAENILSYIFSKKITISNLSFVNVAKVLPWFLLIWASWCISFFFLAAALVNFSITFHIAWGFGLAGALGILAIIFPGGIGVREGILTGYLSLAGLDIEVATTIAVASRLWFIAGEIFIFALGMILHLKRRK